MSEVHKTIQRWAHILGGSYDTGSLANTSAQEMVDWLKSPAADFVAVPREKIEALRTGCVRISGFASSDAHNRAIDAILSCAEPPPKVDAILEALYHALGSQACVPPTPLVEKLSVAIRLRDAELKERSS